MDSDVERAYIFIFTCDMYMILRPYISSVLLIIFKMDSILIIIEVIF